MKVLVTAGGTKELIDPVRCITNVSSGSLGRALCLAAVRRGHAVLLLAPAELPKLAGALPKRVEHRSFRSTADLERELRLAARRRWDLVIHAAAVSDYRPVRPSATKLSSESEEIVLRLVRTPKLIARFRKWFGRAFLVGFKLSTGLTPEERRRIALEQIRKNRTDLCVENDLAEFGPGEHKATIVTPEGKTIPIPKGDKAFVAEALWSFMERKLPEGRRGRGTSRSADRPPS